MSELPLHPELAGRRIVVHHRQWVVAKPEPLFTPLLEQAGYEVELRRDDCLTAGPDDVLLLMSTPTYFRRTFAELERLGSRRPVVGVWINEPLPMPRSAGLRREGLNHRQLGKIVLRRDDCRDHYSNGWRLRSLVRRGLIDTVAVLSAERQAYLAEHGVPSEVVQYGWYEGAGRDLGLERDIDVLFLGGLNRSRVRKLRRLRRRGVPVVHAGSWTDHSTWGEGRTQLMNRVKIELNLARIPGSFPGLRPLIGLANGTLLVSEPLVDPAPYVSGRHFVSAELADMPEAVAYYLAHEDERAGLVAAGQALLHSELTLERSVERVLGLLAAAARERG
jgi:hypothetical protein